MVRTHFLKGKSCYLLLDDPRIKSFNVISFICFTKIKYKGRTISRDEQLDMLFSVFKSVVTSFFKILVKSIWISPGHFTCTKGANMTNYEQRLVHVYMLFEYCIFIVENHNFGGKSWNLFNMIFQLNQSDRSQGYKTFFMLNSTEHEISTAHKN